jgi:Zn-dependent protease with chaperone function
MTTTLRALLALALLALFLVFGGAIVAGLVIAGIATWRHSQAIGGRLIGLAILTAVVMAVALWRVVRSKPRDPSGVRVTAEQAPELWHTVTDLAATAGTRPPDEIMLISEVNAAVTEHARLLGLVGGRRFLLIGVPLLQALSVDEVRGILGHELGHYSRHHTRLGAVTYRARATVIGTVVSMPRGIVRILLATYAELYMLVEAGVTRAQEREADLVSIEVAGKAAATSALRKLPALDAAWTTYINEYVAWGLDTGAAPAGIVRHFTDMLNARDIDLLDGPAPDRPASRWDSHPPIAARVAAIEALADPTLSTAPDHRPAHALIPDMTDLLAGAEGELFDLGDRDVLSFDAYTSRAGRLLMQERADRLYRGAGRLADDAHPGLATVLALDMSGRHDELVRAALGGPADLARLVHPEEEYRQLVRDAVRGAVVDSGIADWDVSWSDGVRLVGSHGGPVRITDAVDALQRGDAEAARAALDALGVDVHGSGVVGAADVGGDAEFTGAVTNIIVNGKRRDVIVLSTGLVFTPPCAWAMQSWPASENRLRRRLGQSPRELIATPGHAFMPLESVASADMKVGLRVRFTVQMHDGSTLTLRPGQYSRTVVGPDAMETMLGTIVGRTRAERKAAAAA